MAVRRRDVDPAGLNLLVVTGVYSREWSRPTEYTRECADTVGGEMLDNEHGRRQVPREGCGQTRHGCDASGGKSYYDDIVTGHLDLFPEAMTQ